VSPEVGVANLVLNPTATEEKEMRNAIHVWALLFAVPLLSLGNTTCVSAPEEIELCKVDIPAFVVMSAGGCTGKFTHVNICLGDCFCGVKANPCKSSVTFKLTVGAGCAGGVCTPGGVVLVAIPNCGTLFLGTRECDDPAVTVCYCLFDPATGITTVTCFNARCKDCGEV
jgi:hypothetical protein